MGEQRQETRFTDYVLSIDGPYRQDVWDYLEFEVLPALQSFAADDVGLSSHEANHDGETFHSVRAERDAAQAVIGRMKRRLEDTPHG